jgi:integrase
MRITPTGLMPRNEPHAADATTWVRGAHVNRVLVPSRRRAGTGLIRKLAKLGAPADFTYHAMRHTVATWLENNGHSEFERGLVLNHSGSGVTAGYSHGYALDLKLALLTKWADHVERLVAPGEGVTRLR